MDNEKSLQKTISEISVETDVQVLLTRLEALVAFTVHAVAEMGAIVRRLEELGHEVTIQLGIVHYLRLVGHGQLSAELLVNVQGNRLLLDQAMRLPLPMQQSIARNEPVRVMNAGGSHRMVPALELEDHEIRQVFFRGRMRTEAQQIGYLGGRASHAEAPEPARPWVVQTSPRRGILIRKETFLTPQDVRTLLHELREEP